MRPKNRFLPAGLLALCLIMAASFVWAQAAAPTPGASKKKPAARPKPTPTVVFEPRAIEVLKASCAKLAAAGSISFTAHAAYEVPSLWGPPVIYGRISEVVLQRPDKLAVLTIGDGPRTEFYDDGKVMMSFHPAENLVAIADAPPTIDAALERLYTLAGTYFPFTDIIVSDPWKDMSSGLTGAFYLGESMLVGGVTTDVVAYDDNGVFIQMWIGKEDKLPRMVRAMFYDDPLELRHSVQFSNWRLDPPVAPDAFTTAKAGSADRIAFNHPKMKSDLPPAARPVAGGKKPASKPTPKPQ